MKKKTLLYGLICTTISVASYATDLANLYIDNNLDITVYAQFHERSGNWPNVCSTRLKNDKLYPIAPYSTIDNDYEETSYNSVCHGTVNIYSDAAGQNLIGKENFRVDTGVSTAKQFASHDTPPTACAPYFSCSTNLTNGSNHLHFKIKEGNTYAHPRVYNQTNKVLSVQVRHISGDNCDDTVDASKFEVKPGEFFEDGIRNTKIGSTCKYNMMVYDGDRLLITENLLIGDNANNETYLNVDTWSINVPASEWAFSFYYGATVNDPRASDHFIYNLVVKQVFLGANKLFW